MYSSPKSERRRQRVEALQAQLRDREGSWKSILEKDSSLRSPWDATKIPVIVRAGLETRSSLESKLRSAHTLRRAIECASAEQRVEAFREPLVAGALHYYLDFPEGTAAVARLQEHCLMTIVHALGSDSRLDEELILDAAMIQQLHKCLNSNFVVVVAAASQLVRRISELDNVCTVLALDEVLLSDILSVMESVQEPRIHPHIMSALINMAAHPKLQFMLARCARLVQWLVECVFEYTGTLSESIHTESGNDSRHTSSSSAPRGAHRHHGSASQSPTSSSNTHDAGTAIKCVRVLANLLSNKANTSEVQELVPSIYDAMLNCQHRAAPPELADASKCVVHLLHDNPVELHHVLSAELSQRNLSR